MVPSPPAGLAAREVVIAQLESLSRRAPVNAGATILNALLLFAVLVGTAPTPWLAVWTGVQVLGGLWVFLRSRRTRPKPRGSSRGLRRATTSAAIGGLLLGSGVALLGDASEFQRFIVFLTVAAMASGASTTLAVVPGAAYGYVLGALLPVAAYWLLLDELGHLALAGLAGCLTLFLLRNASVVHQSFLESLLQKHETRVLRERFREEQEEWLDLSRGTDAFALLDEQDRLLLYNAHFEELARPFVVARGKSYRELLECQKAPRRVDDEDITREQWLQARLGLHQTGAELLEETDSGYFRVTCNSLPSGRRALLIVDVTALKRAELALREGEAAMARSQRAEMVGTLSAGVAHDFNNLLMAIRGAAQLLQREVRSEEGRELLDDIETAVERGGRLTRQLLAAGKKQLLKPTAFDVNDVVRHCTGLLRRSIPASIGFELQLEEELAPALADPGQVEQVLINLALNARDAMPEGGTLRITTENHGTTHVQVAVEDTGQGLTPALIERVFEPFFTTKANHSGSGLGLSVAQGIVRQSGGTLTAQNAQGGGARFVFTLPVGLPPTRQAISTPTQHIKASKCLAILVVDDEPTVRSITMRILKSKGHRVVGAADADEALRILRDGTSNIELLITDVVMPGLSGPKLAEAAKAIRPELVVLYITGYDAGALGEVGPAVVVQKPFSSEELALAIERALRDLRQSSPEQTLDLGGAGSSSSG